MIACGCATGQRKRRYEKWDTQLRHIETRRLLLRTRTCLYNVDPWGKGWNITAHLPDGSRGTGRFEDRPNITIAPYPAQSRKQAGQASFDLKYWYVRWEKALASPFEPNPLYYNVTTQKIENGTPLSRHAILRFTRSCSHAMSCIVIFIHMRW